MTSSKGFQQHFSIISKSVCCGFYMKKNVAFTLISFAVLKSDDCLSVQVTFELKFIYSDKTTKFCEISTVDLSYVCQSNLQWRFHKILWPSQNIWTLPFQIPVQLLLDSRATSQLTILFWMSLTPFWFNLIPYKNFGF